MAIKILRRNSKAQSAMEYLMTYGWAILIIAVVLGALFSLGVFSGASLLGNSCIAGPGFLCGSMVLSHTTGNLGVQIGQSTGTNWVNAIIIYAAQGNSILSNAPLVPAAATQTVNALVSGQTVTVSLQALPTSTAGLTVGAPASGSIWACYITAASTTLTYSSATGACTAASGTVYYTQIATLTVKAT